MSDVQLDPKEWALFCKLLGKTKNSVRLRSFFPKGHPLKDRDHGKKHHADRKWIQECQNEGRGVYIVINDGGDTDKEITSCRAIFYEHDDISKEDQINLWQILGLPQPSLQVDTGGKSIHNYWILKKGIDSQTWRETQERLLDHADADRALKNPSRVMRLPGTYHMNDDGKPSDMTTIITHCDNKYSIKELQSKLPSKKQTELVKQSLSFTQFEPLPFDQIEKALHCIPPRIPNTNTYSQYRNLLWGLIKACEQVNKTQEDAISLMEHHSPEWKNIRQVARSGGHSINANSFWFFAKEYGFQIPKAVKIPDPINPSKEIVVTFDRLENYQANEFLGELRRLKDSPNPLDPFRYNEYTQQIQKGVGKGSYICEGEHSLERYYLKLATKGKKMSKELAMDCIVQVAKEYPYNPVTEYLLGLGRKTTPCDIDRLATQFLRPEDWQYNCPTIYDEMLRKTLIAAVYRALKPGCKWDNACILIGEQGCRKSTFWATLAGEFFSDSLRDIHSKDSYQVLSSAWIHEWAELESITSKRMAGDIKSFLSQSTDIYRVPYGKVAERFKRRSIIVGTSNRMHNLLQDETGNRRYFVIPVTKTQLDPINISELLLLRDQIWCACYNATQNKEALLLSDKYQRVLNIENEQYITESPWKTVIESFIENPQNRHRELTTEIVLTEAIEKPVERQTRFDQMQCATILKDLGYEKKRRGSRNSRKWVYIRDSLDVQPVY